MAHMYEIHRRHSNGMDRRKWLVVLDLVGDHQTVLLPPSAFKTYDAFKTACALEGMFVQIPYVERSPRAWKKARWLSVVAEAINAGDMQLEERAL